MVAVVFPWPGHVWGSGWGRTAFRFTVSCALLKLFAWTLPSPSVSTFFPWTFGFIARGTFCPLGFLIKVLQVIPSPRSISPEGVSWSKGLHCAAEERGADPCSMEEQKTLQLLHPSPTGPSSSRICPSRTQKPSLASQRTRRARTVHWVSLGKGQNPVGETYIAETLRAGKGRGWA